MSYVISHFFEWGLVPDSLLAVTLSEYADCGAENLVLMHQWSERLLTEPDFIVTLRQLFEKFRLGFAGAHAPFGEKWDPGVAAADVPAMIAGQSRVIQAAGQLGIDSITFHLKLDEERFDEIVGQLKMLLSAAEDSRVVIALENGFVPASFDFIKRIIDRIDSPWLACCFDTGHANLAATALGCSLAELIERPEVTALSEKIVVVHAHDNHGVKDEHLLVGDGAIDWNRVASWLSSLPNLRSLQNECASYLRHASVLRQALEFRRRFRQP